MKRRSTYFAMITLSLLSLLASGAFAGECKELPAQGRLKRVTYLVHETSGTYSVEVRFEDLLKKECVASVKDGVHKYTSVRFDQEGQTYGTVTYRNVETGLVTQSAPIQEFRFSREDNAEGHDIMMTFGNRDKLERIYALRLWDEKKPAMLFEKTYDLSGGPRTSGRNIQLEY